MSKPSTFDQLPPSWQDTVKEMRDECKRYRLRLRAMDARIGRLRTESANYRIRLRAAEARIAELEARRNV